VPATATKLVMPLRLFIGSYCLVFGIHKVWLAVMLPADALSYIRRADTITNMFSPITVFSGQQ
jgi:hypothetical protein